MPKTYYQQPGLATSLNYGVWIQWACLCLRVVGQHHLLGGSLRLDMQTGHSEWTLRLDTQTGHSDWTIFLVSLLSFGEQCEFPNDALNCRLYSSPMMCWIVWCKCTGLRPFWLGHQRQSDFCLSTGVWDPSYQLRVDLLHPSYQLRANLHMKRKRTFPTWVTSQAVTRTSKALARRWQGINKA